MCEGEKEKQTGTAIYVAEVGVMEFISVFSVARSWECVNLRACAVVERYELAE